MKVAKFGFSLFGINCYVVYDPATAECAVIDPGIIEPREEQAIVGFIEKNGLKVVSLINTHLHIDHAIGDSLISRRYNVPVSAHPDDSVLGERLSEQAKMFGMSERADGVEITEYLHEGDIVKIGEGELEVLWVPGHSPGSIVLYDRADGFIICGDVLFQGSIGRTDLPGGSMPKLIEGIKTKLLTLPDNTEVFPGHGPATTIGAEKRTNPFLV